MYTIKLRRVGGSTMLPIPPVMLDQMDLSTGAEVALTVESGHLVVEPCKKRYTLEELLAQSDYSQPQPVEEREWIDVPAVGRELI